MRKNKGNHLQQMKNQLPNIFTDATKLIKSYISAVTIPGWVIVLKEQVRKSAIEELFTGCLKCGRPLVQKIHFHEKEK